MAIENTAKHKPMVMPLVQNWVSPDREPDDDFLHRLEFHYSHDELWPHPYDHLYVSLRSGRTIHSQVVDMT